MIIHGNTVGTTTPRADWNQTNPKKVDFIENKPTSDKTLSVEGAFADAASVGKALTSKAPAGYGFGENLLNRSGNVLAAWEDSYEAYCSKVDSELAKMENGTAKLVLARGVVGNGDMYQAAENAVAILYRGNSAEYAHLTTLSHGSVTPGALWRMQKTNGVWGEPEWVNPPLVTNVVYRTTERYQGAAVYKKVDENGNLLWRKEGETSWRTSGSGGSGGGASGEDGITPHIGANGNWWIGTEDTGVKAAPEKGVDYFTEEDKTEIVNEVLAALPKYNGTVEVV